MLECQGLGSPRIFRSLRSLLRREHLVLVFLSETRLDASRVNGICLSLGFDGGFDVDRWIGGSSLPWIIGGDFNEVLRDEEKVGGRFRSHAAISSFRDAIDSCRLVDIGYQGSLFTWSNRQNGDSLIQERLDRVLCSMTWAQEADCRSVVEQAWQSNQNVSVILDLLGSVAAVTSSLSSWNQQKRRQFNQEINDLLRQLKEEHNVQGGFKVNWDRIRDIEWKLDKVLAKKEEYWRQRSRTLWLQGGDKNTKFFHSKASLRRKRNRILGLMDDNGTWRDKDFEIEKVVGDFYENLFNSSSPSEAVVGKVLDVVSCSVSSDMNRTLFAKFSMDDVLFVLKSLAPLKASGPDGLPAAFFQRFWDVVGNKVGNSVLAILNDGAPYGIYW
ncbi:hypothetical protein ACOSP7_025462 [Xanthoceras sorbifolium]